MFFFCFYLKIVMNFFLFSFIRFQGIGVIILSNIISNKFNKVSDYEIVLLKKSIDVIRLLTLIRKFCHTESTRGYAHLYSGQNKYARNRTSTIQRRWNCDISFFSLSTCWTEKKKKIIFLLFVFFFCLCYIMNNRSSINMTRYVFIFFSK